MRVFERRSAAVTADLSDPGTEVTPEGIVGAIDAAVSFTAGRELLAADHAVAVVAILRTVPVPEAYDGVVDRALEDLATWIAHRPLVPGMELVDRLLDLRLEVMPSTEPAVFLPVRFEAGGERDAARRCHPAACSDR